MIFYCNLISHVFKKYEYFTVSRKGHPRSGDRIPVGARFFAHVQTDPGTHPASCTMGIGSFPGVRRPGRGVDHPPPSSAEVENE
jgi:hypothetical protein